MKLILKSVCLVAFLATVLASCNYKTEAHKKLEIEKDSILALQQSQLAEMEEYLDLIQGVDSAFDEIRVSQNILTFASYDSEDPSENMRHKGRFSADYKVTDNEDDLVIVLEKLCSI